MTGAAALDVNVSEGIAKCLHYRWSHRDLFVCLFITIQSVSNRDVSSARPTIRSNDLLIRCSLTMYVEFLLIVILFYTHSAH